MPTRPLIAAGIVLASIALSAAHTAAQQPTDLTAYLMSDRAAEIALARSAAPKHISDSAAVLVLTRSGYVAAVRGTNGFTCMVQRSFDGRLAGDSFWNPKTLGPMCLNPPATRTMLPEIIKYNAWIMAGMDLKTVVARVKKGYASHEFAMPAPGAMSLMLSPDQVLAEGNVHWMPHLMFYYDRTQSPAAWGVGGETNTLIDGSADDAESPTIMILVPVRRWADGKTAMPAAPVR